MHRQSLHDSGVSAERSRCFFRALNSRYLNFYFFLSPQSSSAIKTMAHQYITWSRKECRGNLDVAQDGLSVRYRGSVGYPDERLKNAASVKGISIYLYVGATLIDASTFCSQEICPLGYLELHISRSQF